MSISEKTLKQIHKNKLEPKPRWRFLLKDYVILAAAGISALIGAISIALIIYVAGNRDWFLYLSRTHKPPFVHLLLDLPYIWIIILLLTILIAIYNVRHSRSGYQYSPYLVVIGSLIFSLVFGVIFHLVGFGADIDTRVGKKISLYRSIEKRATELWSKAEEGHLGGEFVKKINDTTIEVRDLEGKIWQVDIANIKIAGPAPQEGQRLKITGDKTGDNTFKAEEIRPWPTPNLRMLFPKGMK